MRLIRGIHNLRASHRGCVASIGNFDGVHLGHQRILDQVIDEARARGKLATVMLFEPQPQEFFCPDQAPARLNSLRDKLIALRDYGVDQVLCARFNESFRSLTAEAFVRDLLVEGLGIDYLVVGDDFRFGRGRDGDFDYLQQAGERFGFQVTDTPTCEVDASGCPARGYARRWSRGISVWPSACWVALIRSAAACATATSWAAPWMCRR